MFDSLNRLLSKEYNLMKRLFRIKFGVKRGFLRSFINQAIPNNFIPLSKQKKKTSFPMKDNYLSFLILINSIKFISKFVTISTVKYHESW